MLANLKFYWAKTNRWHRALFCFLWAELGWLPAWRPGFICKDPSLSHEFNGDTITMKWLFGVTLFLPLVVMLITERFYYKNGSNQLAIKWYKEYGFGLLLNLTVVQTLKMLVGTPRPHFFHTCQPLEADTCTESEYVNSYSCTQGHWLSTSRSNQSFPSGHTSMAFHTAVFVVWYLYRRVLNKTDIKVVCVQTALGLGAIFCAISRLIDHRHHLIDVLAGAVIAIGLCLYTIFYLCNDFQCKASESTYKEKPAGVETKLQSQTVNS